MNIDITSGKKPHFESIEDVMQTFFSIARAVYDIADEECTNEGIVTMLATTDKGRIRIKIDYVKEGETE